MNPLLPLADEPAPERADAINRELATALGRVPPDLLLSVLTQVVVQEDAESLEPTKPIGPFLPRHRARVRR